MFPNLLRDIRAPIFSASEMRHGNRHHTLRRASYLHRQSPCLTCSISQKAVRQQRLILESISTVLEGVCWQYIAAQTAPLFLGTGRVIVMQSEELSTLLNDLWVPRHSAAMTSRLATATHN